MDSAFILLHWFKHAHICIQVTSLHTGAECESMKFVMGNQFCITMRNVGPTICKQRWQVKYWKAKARAEKANKPTTRYKSRTHVSTNSKLENISITNDCCHCNTESVWRGKSSDATASNPVAITHRQLVQSVRYLELLHNNINTTAIFNDLRCSITFLYKSRFLKPRYLYRFELTAVSWCINFTLGKPVSKMFDVHCYSIRYATHQNVFIIKV